MRRKTPKQITVAVSDLSELLKAYSSGWVALSEDQKEVVAAGSTLEDAQQKAAEHGYSHPLFLKVLPPDRGYVPAESFPCNTKAGALNTLPD